jgi:hypothetical protein
MEIKKTIEDQLSAKPFFDNMLNDRIIQTNQQWLEHPEWSDANFDILIDIAIKDAEQPGMSQKTRSSNSNLFSWVYIQGNTYGAFSKNTKLEKFSVWFVSIQGRINVLFCVIVLPKLRKWKD